MTLNCFVCGKKLEPAITLAEGVGTELSPPHGGTRFTSRGNYGSFFDPTNDAEFMEINVCDPCLLAAAQDGRVAYGRTSLAVHVEYEAFDVERFT